MNERARYVGGLGSLSRLINQKIDGYFFTTCYEVQTDNIQSNILLMFPFDCMAKEIYQDNDLGALPDVLST